MVASTLNIDGKKFRVVPEEDYQTMRRALRQVRQQTLEDRADAAEVTRRLSDPKEKRIPWSHVKKRSVSA